LVRSESVFICANRADDLFAQKIKEEEVIMVGTLARLQLGAPSSEQTPDDEPPLRAHDAELVQKSVRIDIPFANLRSLGQIAELLRTLAEDFDAAHREILPPTNHPDFHRQRRLILLDMAMRTNAIRGRLRALHPDRNKNGTF
jgi:hypothetical protein